jgi:hypothetical protein
MIIFPQNPTLNQEYEAPDGRLWRFNGFAWLGFSPPLTADKIVDFTEAVVAAAPPTTNASLLTTGTLPDARLAATIARSADLTTEQNARIAGDAALSTRIDFLASNLDPAALDSIAEAAASIGSLQTQIDGKATAAQGAKADTALQPEPVTYRGAYNNGLDYTYNDVVTYTDGLLYIRVSNPNNPGYPPGHFSWALFRPEIGSPAYDLWVSAEFASKADTIHAHMAADIADFASAVVATAPSLDITTTVRIGDGASVTFPIDGLVSSDPEHVFVALNGVTQTPGTDYLVSEATGTITFDSAPADGMQISCTALGLRTVQRPIDPTLYLYAFDQSANGLTTYSGRLLNADRPAAPALPETATTWTVKRSTLNAAGQILATASATGSWANRTSLSYT